MKELIPLCNEKDEVVGSIEKEYLHGLTKEGAIKPYHRSVQIFILNSELKLLVHKTSEMKGDKGGKWNVSASGHVIAGENYEDAAVREVLEEASIRVRKKDLNMLTQIPGNKYTGWEHARVYYVITNKNIAMNSEASDWFYAPLNEVKDKLDRKELPFSKVFSVLFQFLWNRMKGVGSIVRR